MSEVRDWSEGVCGGAGYCGQPKAASLKGRCFLRCSLPKNGVIAFWVAPAALPLGPGQLTGALGSQIG